MLTKSSENKIVYVEPTVHKEIKIQAAIEGKTMGDVVKDLLNLKKIGSD